MKVMFVAAHSLANALCGTRLTIAVKTIVAFAFLLVLAPPVHAQIIEGNLYYYTETSTINTNIFGSKVVIGKMPGGTFASAEGDTDLGTTEDTKYTVTVATGAFHDYVQTGGGYELFTVFNRNSVVMTGGYVHSINGVDTSSIYVYGGTVGQGVGCTDNATLYIGGGNVHRADNFHLTDIAGGTIAFVDNEGNGIINISGGTIGYAFSNGGVYGLNKSITNISGGTIARVQNWDTSILNISGGIIGEINPIQNSTVNISGGAISSIIARNDSTVNIGGGIVTDIDGYENAIFSITGGNIGHNTIRLSDNSKLDIRGNSLALFSSSSGNDGSGSYTEYFLSGTLEGGQSISGVTFRDYSGGYTIGGGQDASPLYFNGIAAQVTAAAPEPGTVALLAAGVPFAALVLRRRKA